MSDLLRISVNSRHGPDGLRSDASSTLMRRPTCSQTQWFKRSLHTVSNPCKPILIRSADIPCTPPSVWVIPPVRVSLCCLLPDKARQDGTSGLSIILGSRARPRFHIQDLVAVQGRETIYQRRFFPFKCCIGSINYPLFVCLYVF